MQECSRGCGLEHILGPASTRTKLAVRTSSKEVMYTSCKIKAGPQYRQFSKSQFCRRWSLRQKQRRAEMQASRVEREIAAKCDNAAPGAPKPRGMKLKPDSALSLYCQLLIGKRSMIEPTERVHLPKWQCPRWAALNSPAWQSCSPAEKRLDNNVARKATRRKKRIRE